MGAKVVILQPSFMPWLGYLDQYAWCDHFVVYDDVQYDKHGWRNRNRILTRQGVQWLTVPVRVKGHPPIRAVAVDSSQGWQRKHLETIRQAYGRAPYFDWLWPDLETYYGSQWELLLDWLLSGLLLITQKLSLPWKVVMASELDNPPSGRSTERLVAICCRLGASDYLSGDAAQEYLEVPRFEERGIKTHWHGYRHPVYPQGRPEFAPYLSVLDLLFWCGPDSLKVLWLTL